ncbi:lysoplasmalogenase family protein [Paramicrobacterium chengjingii]|uniref:Lysoplasmalogenase n=1 Tax=Paramicrobacterium chengjingii TaxID=2769067 RepID=A0ABX6YEQ8_9MICO|nr:lysoplasmalogenase family protein [Microbacterium chengjingii]QPZ37084.1 lysoplasmalogenase [Microbacterium chengjingii]
MRSSIPRVILAWSFVPFAVGSSVHVLALGVSSPLAAPTKLFLMPLLLIPVAVMSRRLAPRAAIALLVSAIALSWFGDAAGAFFGFAPELPTMLLFFGLAHIAYMLLFAIHARLRRLPLWTLIYGAWWVAMLAVLGSHVGALIIAIALYGLVLAGTATLAARCHPLTVWGGILFLLSDSILAFRLFLPEGMPAWTSPAVMATYAAGQALIVAGVLLTLSRARDSQPLAAVAP